MGAQVRRSGIFEEEQRPVARSAKVERQTLWRRADHSGLGAVESRLPSRNGAQVWREKERSLAWLMSRLRHRARRIGRDGQ